MTSWSLSQCCNLLSRRKPRSLSIVPISLACLTAFLVLVYVSFTSNNLSLHHKNNISPTLVVKLEQHDIVSPQNNTSDSQKKIHHTYYSATYHEDEDHLIFSDTTSIPPLNNDLPPTISGLLANKDTRDNDDNVYHDKDIFLQNFEEMKKNLKIYIYPHKKTDPFASSLLPVVGHEPGGNYASESYFKNVLYKSHFVTNDPSKADLFYLPFSIASLRHDRRVGVGGLPNFVRDYMMEVSRNYPYWNRTGGADHFYVACHSIGRMAMEKVNHVKSNAIQVICSSSYFLPNYFTHKDVCLPQIWPRHEEPQDLGLSKRKRLAFFAGAMNSPVRKAVLRAWENDSSIFVYNGRLKTPYSKQLLGSKYCLHIKGFEVNTARIGDSIFYGCVPVILADYYDLPFMDILNWKSFSVVVTHSDIPKLKEILSNINPQEYSALQANVLKIRKHFQWNKHPLDYDAFYMVMYELWLRRSSIRLVSVL